MHRILKAAALSSCCALSLSLAASPAWADQTKSKTLYCGVNERVSIGSNTISWANHWWRGKLIGTWSVGGWHYSNASASGLSGLAKVEANTILSWNAHCYCPSGVTCGS